MTTSYKDLLKERQALDSRIEEARTRELADAVAKVRSIIAEYGLTEQDVFPAARAGRGVRAATTGAKVAPKYRNGNGDTWTGRGKPPKWIQGQDRAQFLIA
ncbi:MAG: H-NS histone family protein [Comamonadaceae bacterium]|nr:H-NS histone family protein [Comamonadaceae bacterium]